jgi:hypothetical protein
MSAMSGPADELELEEEPRRRRLQFPFSVARRVTVTHIEPGEPLRAWAKVTRDRYGFSIACSRCKTQIRRRTHNGAHIARARHNREHRARDTAARTRELMGGTR